MSTPIAAPSADSDHIRKLEAIGRLAAGIAHEINTPVQFIGDNLHFLGETIGALAHALTVCRNQPSPMDREELERRLAAIDVDYIISEAPKAIAQSLEGVQRVAALVKAMKEFSHPDAGVWRNEDLNQAIRTTLTIARNEYKYVADVVPDLDPDLPPVPCFGGAIQQVVLNLLVNAAHAVGEALRVRGESRGTITVQTRKDGSVVEIRVIDNGTGIPKAIQPRMFEEFFTTKPAGRGTGQGLHLCRQIVVVRHGGSIGFTTSEGQGTTFFVRLPLEQTHV
jgi:signal transduction histidine kinase